MSQEDYEPAITETTTDADGAESAPIVKREAAAAREEPVITAPQGSAAREEPVANEPRGARVISDKVRAMFKDIATKHADGEPVVADDLVPMEHTASPPAAPVAAVAVAPPAPVATPAAPSPVAAAAAPFLPPPAPAVDVGKAAAEQARLVHEMRDKELAEREAKLVEREKRLPASADLIERPGATLIGLIKTAYGVEDGADLKDILTDIVTELAEAGLGATLPADVKTPLEARKAVRSVKAYKADLTRQTQAIAAERAAADKAAAEERAKIEAEHRERQAVQQVTALVQSVKDQHPFLHAQEDPAGIVVEVIKEQVRRDQPVDWQAAAKFADDYYRTQAEADIKKADRFRTLLAPAPAPAVAPAKAAASPGGAPGPAPTTPPTPAPAVDDPTDQPMDRHERRAQQVRRLAAKHLKGVAAQ